MQAMSIKVLNFRSGSTVSYSLPLLVGDIKSPLHPSSVDVITNDNKPVSWPVHNGRFKTLVPLKPGKNVINIQCSDEAISFVLNHEVPTIDRYVSPVYIKCCDDDGSFQGLPDQECSIQSALDRISLGAKLLQTFTAEKLKENGFGHRTYVLEHDLYPDRPPARVFTSKLKVADARRMTGTELWTHFAKELMTSRLNGSAKDMKCKWLAFLSFTRYLKVEDGKVPKTHSDVLNNTKGHTALGGGGLALYGTGTLHCWARYLEDVPKCFTDTRKIDRTQLMDDSAYREFYWANYSTGLGASLHELGHTFDLAHTPTGVMARGFDDLYRVFVVQPLATRGSSASESSRSASPVPYSPKESPIHRPKSGCSRSGSPKPCPPLRPQGHARSLSLTDTHPRVVTVEAAFRRVQGPTKLTFTQNNYDGSQTKKSVLRYVDGTEHITEVTLQCSGEQTIQEHLKHTPSGKSRTTMSLSMCPCDPLASSLPGSPVRRRTSSSSSDKSTDGGDPYPHLSLAKLCTMPNGVNFQEMRCHDGGAHWYRSSAVLLRYHKWFQRSSVEDAGKKAPTMKGRTIEAEAGLRIVELRSQPEGVVVHHWEFLGASPVVTFVMEERHVHLLMLHCKEVTVFILDDHGNSYKQKMALSKLLDHTRKPTENET